MHLSFMKSIVLLGWTYQTHYPPTLVFLALNVFFLAPLTHNKLTSMHHLAHTLLIQQLQSFLQAHRSSKDFSA